MLKHILKKYYRYEFWPFKVFYFPFIPLWLYYSIKNKSLAYFCIVNPQIKWGGFTKYSKYDVIKDLPQNYLPKTILYKKNNLPTTPPLSFPFIIKPDVGERGIGVEKIESITQWEFYINTVSEDIIIQSFITEPLEFGIFYARFPTEDKGDILSITGKTFLEFIGDGKTSIKEFIYNNHRAYYRKEYLLNKFNSKLSYILPKGEKMILEEIGNHNRGTYFYDASCLINEKINLVVDHISKSIDSFYYGRYDVKAHSIEDFLEGKFLIMEINGSNSEATHIYDKKYNLLQAYKEVYRHLKVQARIAQELITKGVEKPSFIELLKEIL